MPQLIAMSASGDVIVSEQDGVHWLHLPPTAGDVRRLDADDVDRYINFGSLTLVNESFDSYVLLDAAVAERASQLEVPELDTSQWDVHDVRRLLSAVGRRLADGQRSEAQQTLKLLANLDIVRNDATLHAEIIDLLAGAQPSTAPRFSIPPESSLAARSPLARKRWNELAAA